MGGRRGLALGTHDTLLGHDTERNLEVAAEFFQGFNLYGPAPVAGAGPAAFEPESHKGGANHFHLRIDLPPDAATVRLNRPNPRLTRQQEHRSDDMRKRDHGGLHVERCVDLPNWRAL